MARIRTIKPEFWDHEQLGECSSRARLLFAALISDADDEGRGRGSTGYIKALAFKYEKAVDESEVERVIDELSKVEDDKGKLVLFYEVANAAYYWIPGFNRQQRIDRASKSKLPEPPRRTLDEPSTSPRGRLLAVSRIKDQGSRSKDQVSLSDCAEPEASKAPAPPALHGLSLYETDRRLCRDWDKLNAAWKSAYPGVDIIAEVRKAHTWEVANPTRIKKNRARFLNIWLSKAQDQPKRPQPITRSDSSGKTLCLQCGGSKTIAGGVENGTITTVPCPQCTRKAALA